MKRLASLILGSFLVLSAEPSAMDRQQECVPPVVHKFLIGDDFFPGVDAGEAKEYDRCRAENGEIEFQIKLGREALATGFEDYAEAAKWFRMAAEKGNLEAQTTLGILHMEGKGILQDYAEAVNWFRMAAEKGHAKSQLNLAFLYETGRGVDKNYMFAHMWYNIAAANGSSEALAKRTILEQSNAIGGQGLLNAQALAKVCMTSGYKKCD